MTLVIAAHGRNFVVLGADSRGIVGALERERLTIGMDKMRKLTPIAKHVGILTYGMGEFGESLLEGFRKEKESDLDGATNVVEKLYVSCKERWGEWFSGVPREMRPNVGFVVAGLDQKEGEKNYTLTRIYSMESHYDFAYALHNRFLLRGIDPLAMYILNKQYYEGMMLDDLCTLVAYAISETASVDKRVGGPIRIAIIDSKGFREIPEQDVQSMLEE